MKRNRFFSILLLFSMSFSMTHAFVIDMLDTHSCDVSEYVAEFSQTADIDIPDGDICKIHAAFHSSFIVPEITLISREKFTHEKPHTLVKIYEYSSCETLVRPPITL